MLRRAPVYFDDILFMLSHKFAGELLAIDEFNQILDSVKLDAWYGIVNNWPFPESPCFRRFYVAHDLEAISNVSLHRHQPLSFYGNHPAFPRVK